MCTKLAHAHGLVPKDGLLQLLCEGFVAREPSLCLLKMQQQRPCQMQIEAIERIPHVACNVHLAPVSLWRQCQSGSAR